MSSLCPSALASKGQKDTCWYAQLHYRRLMASRSGLPVHSCCPTCVCLLHSLRGPSTTGSSCCCMQNSSKYGCSCSHTISTAPQPDAPVGSSSAAGHTWHCKGACPAAPAADADHLAGRHNSLGSIRDSSTLDSSRSSGNSAGGAGCKPAMLQELIIGLKQQEQVCTTAIVIVASHSSSVAANHAYSCHIVLTGCPTNQVRPGSFYAG